MKNLKSLLKKESELLLPSDEFKQNLKKEVLRQSATEVNSATVPPKTAKKSVKRIKLAFSAAAVLVCLVTSLTLGLYFGLDAAEPAVSDSYVSIDINPSFEIIADKNDVVSSVVGLNNDAVIMLYRKNYVGQKLDAVCSDIVTTAITLGYVKDGKNVELLAVNDNVKKERFVISALKTNIQNTLNAHGKNANVVAKNESVGNNGKDKNKSKGKQAIVEEACKKLGMTEEEAKAFSVGELNKMMKHYDEDTLDALEDMLEQAFEDAGLDVDDDELEDRLDELKKQWKEQYGDDDDDDDDNDDDDDKDGDDD